MQCANKGKSEKGKEQGAKAKNAVTNNRVKLVVRKRKQTQGRALLIATGKPLVGWEGWTRGASRF